MSLPFIKMQIMKIVTVTATACGTSLIFYRHKM